jgi:hypothetical protein
MGLLKTIARFIVGFLFSVSLTLLLSIFLASVLTNYGNIKPIFATVYSNAIMRQLGAQRIEELYNSATLYCREEETVTIPYGYENITLNCNEITNTNSTYLVSIIVEKFFNTFYYKDYGCEFLTCMQKISSLEDAVVVFSSTSHRFFESIIFVMLFVTILIGVALFFLIENWEGRFKSFGVEFLFIGLLYFLTPYLESIVFDKLPPEAPITKDAFDAIFNSVSPVFLIFFIIGAIFIGIWLFIKFSTKKPTSK